METYLLIFTCLMGAVLLVAIGNLILEIVKAKKNTASAPEKEVPKAEEPACACEACAPAEEPAPAPVPEPQPAASVAAAEEEAAATVTVDDNTVVFSKVETAGYADQLQELPEEQKDYYKQLKEHISAFGEIKEVVANKYETVYYKGRNLLIRIQIRKSQLLLKFELPNEQLNDYARISNDKYIKEKLFEIRVSDEPALNTALMVTDIARERIDAEIEKKKEERRAKRRAAAAAKN